MCLPYLMGKAQSFSDNIIAGTPNGIIVLDREMLIQQINASACRLLNLGTDKGVLGRHVSCVLDPAPFEQIVQSGADRDERRAYLAEYGKYVALYTLWDATFEIIICIMRDVTQENAQREQKDEPAHQRNCTVAPSIWSAAVMTFEFSS